MGFNEWSDDENVSRNHGRDKFRHERSLERERYGEEYERYDRKKRGRRSPTPPEGITTIFPFLFLFLFKQDYISFISIILLLLLLLFIILFLISI